MIIQEKTKHGSTEHILGKYYIKCYVVTSINLDLNFLLDLGVFFQDVYLEFREMSRSSFPSILYNKIHTGVYTGV